MSDPAVQRRRVQVQGTVQGVGFRPFVYRCAAELQLTGWVRNDGRGLVFEVQGAPAALEALLHALHESPPPLAILETVHVEEVSTLHEVDFRIVESEQGGTDARVSADVAPCAQCLREMADPADRRFGYPFINCTNCGPRFTIVRAVPYDRPSTTMEPFPMCGPCAVEYGDPADRRFHAQPNACPTCGPQLSWSGGSGAARGREALAAAVRCLSTGGLVAVKGVGGYHLACDAADEQAVRLLRSRKSRADKPFAVMVADLQTAEELCHLDEGARSALRSPRRPVVLAPRCPATGIAADVAPRLDEIGVMLPSSPLHVLLLDAVGRPLVMTSGNRADEPVVHHDAEAQVRLGPLVDGVLHHDREIAVRADDSVVRSAGRSRVQMIRRARGWVPQPLSLPVRAPQPVLGVGAQLKSTVALASQSSVVVSQHLGDLDDWPTHAAFTSAIAHLIRLSDVHPALVAHDLHPDYRSTAWALESGLPLLGVQHHHAHVAACLVEHGVSTPVLGIAFDGTGLGTDGTLWGGEFLLADLTGFTRLGSVLPAALPGGDAAVREPWRMALSWLHRSLGEEAAAHEGPRLDPRWSSVLSLVGSGSSPETSSVGRLFDAVAALLGVRDRVTYEGQAAVELEAVARRADPRQVRGYRFAVGSSGLDPAPLLTELLLDRKRGVPPESLAAGFHRGLATGAAQLATALASQHGVDTVALTGGVFQNALLSDLLVDELGKAGLRVLQHEQLPPNDGSISVGQAAVAAAVLARGGSEAQTWGYGLSTAGSPQSQG
jgi:hydrogenase maturation protein HypF